MNLPPATPKPCNDCPWRRTAARGWLGPFDPEEWIQLAHSDSAIACHQTIKVVDVINGDAVGDWNDPAMRQCAGAAIYRKNVAKTPRDPAVARAEVADRETIFATPMEFLGHHEGGWS